MKRFLPKKKGAIEMSMQTIIIVVIGVTLLILGLRFVYTTFKGIGTSQEEIQKQTSSQIASIFGESEDAISVSPGEIDVKRGESKRGKIYFRNVGNGDISVSLTKTVLDGPDKTAAWIKIGMGTSTKKLKGGDGYETNLMIDPPKTAKVGTYVIEIAMNCQGDEEGCSAATSKEVIVNVKS